MSQELRPLSVARRLGPIMEPEAGNACEEEGVLNPGAVRGPDGELYLFPRLVARGNYSRIGVARVRFHDGEPVGVERLGIALEPEAEYELRAAGGGCEDPRVTYVKPLGRYVMTYTAFGAAGPRIALAVSEDLRSWRRLGLVTFTPAGVVDFGGVDNKDASFFPDVLPDPCGEPALVLIHRPLFRGTLPEDIVCMPRPRSVDVARESMWLSYAPLAHVRRDLRLLGHFTSHHRLISPVAPWERVKIGGGAPPVRIGEDYLVVYHGVSDQAATHVSEVSYAAGLLLLDAENPRRIAYRSQEPVLAPSAREEHQGIVPNVVFPTGVDVRADIGRPRRVDVYYGMADYRIGVAALELPARFPTGALADPVAGCV